MMQIEPWHIPVLAMTLIVLPVVAFWLVGWLRRDVLQSHGHDTSGTAEAERPTGTKLLRTRTITLAVLTLVLLGFSVVAAVFAPPELLNLIAAAMTAVSGAVSATLTIESFRDTRKETADRTETAQPAVGRPGRDSTARQPGSSVKIGGLRDEVSADDSAFTWPDPQIRKMFDEAERSDDADR